MEGMFCGTEYLYYLLMLLYFYLFFHAIYFIPPPLIFILPEAIISITEQRDEFYDKRTFLMERRSVFML